MREGGEQRTDGAPKKNVKQKSEPNLTLTYVLALGLVAFLSVVAYVTLDRLIENAKHVAAIVNVSGNQRMLSQRIVVLARDYIEATEHFERLAVRAELEAAAIHMERSHVLLTGGSPVRGLPATMSPEMRSIYYEEPVLLDRQVTAFIEHARNLLDAPQTGLSRGNADYRYLEEAAKTRFLQSLDVAVRRYEAESEEPLAYLQRMQSGALGVTLAALLGVALFIFRPQVRRVREYVGRLYELANTDPLTGCNNRRNFMQAGDREFTKAQRYARSMSVLMLDIDHFKKINDTYGHAVGDEVLKTLAATCLATIRKADCLGRLGGEEFAVIMPETDLEGARAGAEKLREAVADVEMSANGGIIRFTTSVGVAMLDADDKSIHDILNRADSGLYKAKEGGRNRVELSEPA